MIREHNQEADHLANLGTEGQRRITIEGEKNTGQESHVTIGVAAKRRWQEWVWRCDQSS